MARTIDRLALGHLGELHKDAAYLGFQVNRAWTEAQYGQATPSPLTAALYEAADAVKLAETKLAEAMAVVAAR